eukprot:scaffold287_cov151-Skeletonema_marinoi.AAC.10
MPMRWNEEEECQDGNAHKLYSSSHHLPTHRIAPSIANIPRRINPLSRSMHEMYESPDLNAYADVMEDMNGKAVTPPSEEARDDDVTFIDESSSPRSVDAAKSTRPIQVTTGGGSMMRWPMSMARLPSEVERQKKSFSLLTMVPDMHSAAIEEEEEDDEENAGADDSVASNDVCLDKSLYKGQQLEVRPTNDLTNSANRRHHVVSVKEGHSNQVSSRASGLLKLPSHQIYPESRPNTP